MEPFIETLFRPVVRGQVTVPESGRIVYANAYPTDAALLSRLPAERLVRWQPRRSMAIDAGMVKPRATGVALAELEVPELQDICAGAALAFVPLTKQRRASLAMMATLWEGLADGGTLVAAAPNTGGAKGYERAMSDALGGVSSMSKNKARVFWTTKKGRGAPADWLQGGESVEIAGGWWTRPGVFSWEHADRGSQLLVETLDVESLKGAIFDLGAGWGYLAGELVRAGVDPGRLTLWEDDLRAVRMAARNVPGANVRWCDVTREATGSVADTVVMNPPFHAGHRTDVGLGRAFFEAARRVLRPGGTLWAVANVHLPYEGLIDELFDRWEGVTEVDGFKILRAER